MGKQRVQLHQSTSGVAIETAATVGAVLGVNLVLPDGTVVTEEMLGIGVEPPPEEEYPFTYWRLIMEIPPNVVALAETSTTGLYVITGPGTSATRAIQGTIGRITESNGDGVAGAPTLDLAVVVDAGTGDLVGISRDSWGRVSGTRPVVAGPGIDIDGSDPDEIVLSSSIGVDFTVAVPATTWTINHNLGYRPSVYLIDAGGNQFSADVAHPSINTAIVTIAIATAGTVRLT